MESKTNKWVVDLSYYSNTNYTYGGGGAYYSTNRVPTIKQMWGVGERDATRWLNCGFLNHKDYNAVEQGKLFNEGRVLDELNKMNFKVQEKKAVTYKQAMEMKKRGILRFNIRDSSNPPAAAAAAETFER